MESHTVNVSVKGLFHNGMPFEGILRVKLNAPADGGDNTLILPKEWQEIRFTPQGEAVAQLVPNALLGEGSFYQFEIVTTKNTGAYIYDKYGKKTTVERGVIVVPNRDCNFTEIVTVEPTQPEPLEASKAYASEAKETLRETKEVAAGVQGAANKEIERIEQESVTIRDNALKAITEEGERVKGIVDDNIETSTNAAKRAEDARDTVVEYVDETFPAKVSQLNTNLNNKVKEIDSYLDNKANGINTNLDAKMVAIDAHLENAQTQIISNIDGKATSVNTALDNKLATAQTAINEAVGKAETAKGDAEKAKGQAEGFSTQASTSASNASKSATASATSASQAQGYADEAKASAVDTLKRKIWAEGLLYSDNYNGSLAELLLDYKELQRQFGFTSNDNSYTYFQLWGEHKKWVLCSMDYYHSCFAILDLDAKKVLKKILINSKFSMTNTAAGVCVTNTHLWQYSTNGNLYRYEFDTDTLTVETKFNEKIADITDLYVASASAGIVPLSNGDILVGAKYIVDKDSMQIVGEVTLEEGVVRNITSKDNALRDYAFVDRNDANSATPSPIYFLFMGGMPPLWIDDRWTTDAEGKRVVTLRTIKTDDASIDLGVGISFGIATAGGISALVKGGSSVVRYMTIDTTQSAPNIVKVTKGQSYTYSRTLPSAFCLSKGFTPAADVDSKDAPHIVFKTGAMIAGYFGMKEWLGSGANTKAYETAFVLPSSNKFQGFASRGMHPGGSSGFFPLFGITRNGTSVAITGGQYGNAN